MPAHDHDNDDLYHRLGWFTVADYAKATRPWTARRSAAP